MISVLKIIICLGLVILAVSSQSVSTLAGSGSIGVLDGQGALASFYRPSGVAVDSAGKVYVADRENHKIRQISPTGNVSTFAGSGSGPFGIIPLSVWCSC